jgi:hypothetical protein
MTDVRQVNEADLDWFAERDQSQNYDEFDDGCYECGGEGYVLADCFEDTCCCADPESQHGYIVCPVCRGK